MRQPQESWLLRFMSACVWPTRMAESGRSLPYMAPSISSPQTSFGFSDVLQVPTFIRSEARPDGKCDSCEGAMSLGPRSTRLWLITETLLHIYCRVMTSSRMESYRFRC